MDVGALRASLEKIAGVASVHELHAWDLGAAKYVAACHVVLTPDATGALTPAGYGRVQRQVENVFHNSGIHNATAQLELARGGGGAGRCYLRGRCPHRAAWCCLGGACGGD